MRRRLLVVFVVAAAACRGDAPAVTADPAPLVTAPSVADAGVDAPRDPAMQTRCDEPCLFLRDTPLDDVTNAYRAACGKPLLPDNKDCGRLDYWRNCVYAARGYRFKKAKWQVYATKSWYKPRAEFANRELTALERANVHELRLRARACRHNDVHVSTADFARIQKWFAAPPAVPAVAISGEDLVKPAELHDTLVAQKLVLAKDTWMAYHDPEPAVVAALPKKKLRDVIVDFSSSDEDGGPFVHFVFDEGDALVALVLTDH